MIQIEFLPIVLTGIGIIVSILYYTNTLRISNKARQAQVYTQIWTQFSSPEYLNRYFEFMNREWDDFDDWIEKYGKLRLTDTEQFVQAASLGTYYEGVGVLLKNGFIDIEPVVDLLGTTITSYWDKQGPTMKEYRVRYNNPRAYIYVEYLYNKAKPIILKQNPELAS